MSRETKFKVRDVRRLVEAARAAGLNPTAVEVDVKGCIRVISGKREDAGSNLDKWLEEHPS
jgi:Tfp pilus assembly PilM family ATPase